ncbi:uncharacterized protein LOC121054253 [Oryza brachyantha]|uniref:uncharacterized protein LOC121054253 n=1 Tax=Oryza brachyantha TaxID=4533 RepID=UPI001ADC3922|nr:uncharacterized protein LOC121054253 [Oryza brachyantha]
MVVVVAQIAVASAGLGMLAGVAMANRSMGGASESGGRRLTSGSGSMSSSSAAAALRWTAPPPCAACGGTGREECRLCTRWSDGDCSGCCACAGTRRAPCRSCGGSGTGRRAPVRVSSAPPGRLHLKR